MMKRIAVLSLFALVFSQLVLSVSYADNAEVLPKGISRVRLNGQYYFPVDERFDPDGKEEDVDADYNNVRFDSTVFEDLALVEAGFRLPSGYASVGNSVVSYDIEWRELDFFYEYGSTDRVTVGVHILYWWNKTKINEARLDTSKGTVGKSAIGAGLGSGAF